VAFPEKPESLKADFESDAFDHSAISPGQNQTCDFESSAMDETKSKLIVYSFMECFVAPPFGVRPTTRLSLRVNRWFKNKSPEKKTAPRISGAPINSRLL
jgi:hypothetical protein